jgi:hypothetical protein
MRYYFDLRQGDELAIDEEGVEFETLQQAQEEAARSLADMARDETMIGNGAAPKLIIEVRDGDGPVMAVTFNMTVDRKR